MRMLLVCLTAIVLAWGLAVPATAAPGDNYAPDDVFTSARTQWWRDSRFGMFIHFGLYSAYRGEYRRPDGTICRDAEWIKRNCAIPWAEYEAKAAQFNPSGFDANAVVATARAAGQKHIVITSKHHDGFARWPTAVNDWNIRSRIHRPGRQTRVGPGQPGRNRLYAWPTGGAALHLSARTQG